MTGEKGAATEAKPVTYTLTQSFSHVSYGIGHAPSSPIAPFVTVLGVLTTVTAQL